jgi:hypothetical protein
VTGKCHHVVPPITSVRFQLAESKRFHQQEYLEFPQRADIDTGPLNAHLAPS